MEAKTVESVEKRSSSAARTLGSRLFVVVQFAVYGLAATVGSLSIVTAFQTYLVSTGGGVGRPALSLLGVAVVLGVGWTLLLIALSGAVACGVGRRSV